MVSQSSIQQVKDRYDMWDAWPADRQGKRNGSRYMMGRCIAPDHPDVNPSVQIWHDGAKCWGCGRLFDVIDVVMLTSGLSFAQALDELNGNWHASADKPKPSASLERPDAPRGPLPDDVLSQFKPLEPADVAGLPKLRGLERETMAAFGLRWWGRKVLFPIILGGQVVDVEEYSPDPSLDTPKWKPRWPGRPKVLYNSDKINGRPIFILEGHKSCWYAKQMGVDAVATGGASTFMPEMRALLNQVERLYVCGDHDKAGQRFNEMVRKHVRRAVPVWWSHLVATGLRLGRGYDLADFCQDGGDRALFWEVVAMSELDGAYADVGWASEDEL